MGKPGKKRGSDGELFKRNRSISPGLNGGARGEEMHYGYDRKGSLPGAPSSLPDPPPPHRSLSPDLLLVNFLSTANKRNVRLRSICSGSFSAGSVGSVPLIKTTSVATASAHHGASIPPNRCGIAIIVAPERWDCWMSAQPR